jgi:hypothetical protein
MHFLGDVYLIGGLLMIALAVTVLIEVIRPALKDSLAWHTVPAVIHMLLALAYVAMAAGYLSH